MLAATVLLIALQSSNLQSAIQRVKNRIEQTRAEIAGLQQRLGHDNQKQQIDEDKRQIDTLHQELLQLGNRLGSYQSQQEIEEYQKKLERLFPLKVLPVPPEQPVTPRMKNRT